MGSGIDLMTHQAPPSSFSRGALPRRRHTRQDQEAPLQPRPTPYERSVSSGVVSAHESERGEKMADVEAWESNSPACGGLTEKV